VRVQILKKEKFMFEEFKGTGIPIPTPKKPSGDFLKKLPKIVLIVKAEHSCRKPDTLCRLIVDLAEIFGL